MGRKDRVDQSTIEILAGIEDADPRTAWGTVKRRIDLLRDAGREVPVALVIAERQLMSECMSVSQGR